MQKICCDRCGAVVVKRNLIPGFPKDATKVAVVDPKFPTYTAKEFDLCKDCMIQFREFLDGAAIPAAEKEEECK